MSDHPIRLAEPLSEEALGRLRELLAKATARPWSIDRRLSPFTIQGGDHPRYASIVADEQGISIGDDTREANVALIIAAINALPILLARLDYLEDAYRWFSESGQARKDGATEVIGHNALSYNGNGPENASEVIIPQEPTADET